MLPQACLLMHRRGQGRPDKVIGLWIIRSQSASQHWLVEIFRFSCDPLNNQPILNLVPFLELFKIPPLWKQYQDSMGKVLNRKDMTLFQPDPCAGGWPYPLLLSFLHPWQSGHQEDPGRFGTWYSLEEDSCKKAGKQIILPNSRNKYQFERSRVFKRITKAGKKSGRYFVQSRLGENKQIAMLTTQSKNTWVVCYLHCAVLMEYLQWMCSR